MLKHNFMMIFFEGNLEQEEEVLAFLTNEDSLTIPDKIEEVHTAISLLFFGKKLYHFTNINKYPCLENGLAFCLATVAVKTTPFLSTN